MGAGLRAQPPGNLQGRLPHGGQDADADQVGHHVHVQVGVRGRGIDQLHFVASLPQGRGQIGQSQRRPAVNIGREGGIDQKNLGLFRRACDHNCFILRRDNW